MEWTPWITIVCGSRTCGVQVKREWKPGQLPPKYCSRACKKRENNRRNKVSQNARKQAGEEIGQIVVITIDRCARPGCDRRGKQREWHTAQPWRPTHCSAWCERRDSQERNAQRRRERDTRFCEHPEKRAYMPTEHGLRKVAADAVRFEKYVYGCRCCRFHLTSEPDPAVPVVCVSPWLSFTERRAAWHEYLVPVAQRLRERRLRRSARELSS